MKNTKLSYFIIAMTLLFLATVYCLDKYNSKKVEVIEHRMFGVVQDVNESKDKSTLIVMTENGLVFVKNADNIVIPFGSTAMLSFTKEKDGFDKERVKLFLTLGEGKVYQAIGFLEG